MYIANIVTKNKIKCSSFYNVTSNIHTINKNLPTLIIGWSLVKELFPEQDILDHTIDENISWTFSKREKRYKYEEDIIIFDRKVIDFLNRNVNYHFFNFLIASKEKQDSFISYVKNSNSSIYYNSRFLYLYDSKNKITLGVSLNDLKYIGINVKEFINSIINSNKIVCNDFKCIDENSLSFIKDNIKSIAYLNYLKNTNIYIEKDYNG